MLTLLWLVAVVVGAVALAYVGTPALVTTVAVALALAVAAAAHLLPPWLTLILALAFVIVALALNVPALRRRLVSEGVLAAFRKVLPPMSETEREAIEAGTVWWDGELFSGKPDWRRLLATPKPILTPEEQSFLDHEVEELCALVTDWETTNVYGDLPPWVWQFIKDKGFLGLEIPREYGGKGFSAYAHSRVMIKLSTHSSAVSVSVMVPNSLGPAELLAHYGTDEQKRHYLPRLAQGLEIPCFALTNPNAGSDAASIPDYGIVCWGEHEGERVLGLRVTWEKRYITLAPVATLLGLAFRAYDPEHLVGDDEDLGITCALVPTSHPGVEIGRRHMPLNAVFQNGPTSGNDVFIPMDWVIGGQPMLGRGWRMLMESLARGRGISLPSSSIGLAKLVTRTVGGYARIRQQFKLPIGKFEGIEEPLARIGGNMYMMEATGRLTVRAVDQGEKPAVLSGIAKLHLTQRAREVIVDGMDIVGGKGICMGPSNFLGAAYMQAPISITVEGANILTRSLIVFGQGAIRCHPYVLKEMAAAQEPDHERALERFDAALFGHVRFLLANFARTLVMGLTGSHFAHVPADVAPETRRYYQQLTRFSAALAFLTDVSMGALGGSLKRKEKLSARLGDVLSMLYLCSATLKRYEDEGRQQADAPLMHWAIWDAMFKAQAAIEGVISNFPNRFIAAMMGFLVFPLGRPYVVPSDALGHSVARLMIEPSPTRDRLTAGMYLGRAGSEGVDLIDRALAATIAAEPVEAKIRAALRAGAIDDKLPPGADQDLLLARGQAAGTISAEEAQAVHTARELTALVIRVDDFAPDLGASERKPLVNAAGTARTGSTPGATPTYVRKAAASNDAGPRALETDDVRHALEP
jgi:acyl-CoA dehydrogenase